VVIKLVVVPADDDVMLVALDVLTPGVDFVVLRSGNVDGEDAVPDVVKLAAVELPVEVVEEGVDSLVVVDVLSSISGPAVATAVVGGDVMLETVDEVPLVTVVVPAVSLCSAATVDVERVVVVSAVDVVVVAVLTTGVDFVVFVVPGDRDVTLVTIAVVTPGVGFLVLSTGGVDHVDVVPVVVD